MWSAMCLTPGFASEVEYSTASVGFWPKSAGTAGSAKAKLDLGSTARLAQSVERKALNLAVVGSSPTVGVLKSLACSQRAEHTTGPSLHNASAHLFSSAKPTLQHANHEIVMPMFGKAILKKFPKRPNRSAIV